MTPWREYARVGAYLKAHRGQLVALGAVRCPEPPSPALAEVHVVGGNRWLWVAGTRESPAQLAAMGVDLATYPRSASSVRPLDSDLPPDTSVLSTCRKCRRTYQLDVQALEFATRGLPAQTLQLETPKRWMGTA